MEPLSPARHAETDRTPVAARDAPVGEDLEQEYTAGAAALEASIQKASITRILTTGKLLEKTGIPRTPDMLLIEELLPRMSRPRIARDTFVFRLLPRRWALKHFGREAARSIQDTATIMFSSGSTGIPKGVVLSHANVLANVLGLQQVFDVGLHDRILGVLPFFHSFYLYSPINTSVLVVDTVYSCE